MNLENQTVTRKDYTNNIDEIGNDYKFLSNKIVVLKTKHATSSTNKMTGQTGQRDRTRNHAYTTITNNTAQRILDQTRLNSSKPNSLQNLPSYGRLGQDKSNPATKQDHGTY